MTSPADAAVIDGTATETAEPVARQTAALAPRPAAQPPAPSSGSTTLDMMRLAVERGADIQTIERLMALHERVEANQARRAFDEAVADAKAEIPPIARNRKGHNSKKYADFAAYAEVVDPIISRHGLSYRFRSKQDDRIHVTCILSHRGGHSEETTLSGPPDSTGNKNVIQSIGSTLTYLQRYSLVQALGLAATDDDDGEGAGPGGAMISAAEKDELVALLRETGADVKRFLAHFRVENIDQLPLARFAEAKAALERKRNKAAAGGAQ